MDWQQALETWELWELPTPSTSPPEIINSAPRGNNQNSLIVTAGEQRCAMRLRHIDSEKIGLNWKDEATANRHAASLEISPKVYFCNEHLLVTEYIDGNHKSALSNHDLQQLATILHHFHHQELALSKLDLAEKADFYWQQMGDQQKTECKHIHAELLDLLKAENPFSQHLSPCHNDLNPGNVIFYYNHNENTSNLMLIDWEYSALGNPLFDLAGVIRNWDLSLEESKTFLHYYFQNYSPAYENTPANENTKAQREINNSSNIDYKKPLNQALIACDYLSYLWYSLYEPNSPFLEHLRRRLL
ncbi:MAG: phosphotransferase [Cellvibrionaceae bacterium]